ncbi:Putative uncharacterized protein OS=Mesorhizobium alhagi CCNWXJ12-2 GN=MAXJ12_24667 PE=4 SV=1 [Gemmataceae bacterium]|nr:Putative uncharacterized protein OS=Mesorhizobium alhagi CCNWXJ12-2 GN=MAXJ12_24667 PE=4 SV=1 [Gemmataceae bacterium]VTU00489.1 Putative uncharacterized protein OS=Mesorhizobium alhagi CCNWXJ12-2 GN=MAXJ12_24667 PE=4 SV=1 [Gemmataceae bacterium]
MVQRPEVRPTRLADGRVNPPVLIPAAIVRHFPAAQLAEVEAAWSPARTELAGARAAVGLPLESSHWDWRGKVERVEVGQLSLVAVECESAVQGLMAVPLQPRAAVLTPGERLLYVDYLEVSPWNQRSPNGPRRFLGVGRALIGQAIHMSRERGFNGRVGLHSLPQAEGFYSGICNMRRIGADPDYYDLVYFEYTEREASEWLAPQGIPG